jgi:hypothetical protein
MLIFVQKTMSKFKIVPLTKDWAQKYRRSMKDDFGHTITTELATGHGPCRISLKPFRPGKDIRLLLSHSPFEKDNAFNQPGPIFIHADEVEAYANIHRFPPEIKADRIHFHLTLIGYNVDQRMIFTQLVGERDIDELIELAFDEHPQIEYLHARSAEACCFICRIERA